MWILPVYGLRWRSYREPHAPRAETTPRGALARGARVKLILSPEVSHEEMVYRFHDNGMFASRRFL